MKVIISFLWIGTLLEPGEPSRPYIHPFSLFSCNQSMSRMEVDQEESFLPSLIEVNEMQANASGKLWWKEREKEQVQPNPSKWKTLSRVQTSLGTAWFPLWTSREDSGVKMFIPMYLHMILAALYLGTTGSTANKFQNILGFKDDGCGGSSGSSQRTQDMHQLRLLLRDVLAHQQGSLSTGTWMIFQQGLRLHQTFHQDLQRFYPEIQLGAVNFSQPQRAEGLINDLLQRVTAGCLDNLVTGLSPHTNLLVASFVHFKGKWKTRSQCHGTELLDFYNDAGDKARVPMTIWCGWLQYKTNPEYTVVKLPLSERTYMMVIQPVQPAMMGNVEKAWPDVRIFQTGFVRLVMPRFAWEGTYNAKEMFRQIPDMLGGQANFSKLSSVQHLVPEQVLQSIIFEITEEEIEPITTEDLAVSNITATEIRIDKPFLFRVYDETLDILLLLGRVKKLPLKSELKKSNNVQCSQ
ncbi:angiotensinogen isoform X2 [Narcine bancroftii]